MCSVSFLPNSRGFYLGMNRDESLQRPLAQSPQTVLRCNRVTLYPSEAAGGSWVGVNDSGLCLALINWYAIPRLLEAGRVSRGIVVPSALAGVRLSDVTDIVAALSKRNMAPFRLILFAPRERAVREYRWDQHALGELSYAWEPRHWFSSGCDEPRAQRERGRVARSAWREPRPGSLPWLRRLHGSHEPTRGPFCFCMHRNDAATVSYTELVVTSRTATMRYHDGPLCSVPQPATTHKIPLQTVCKESASLPTNRETTHAHECQQFPLRSPRRQLLSRGLSTRGQILRVTSGSRDAHPSRL